ncbi:hypothetical protein HK103_001884 [Boothiomyces macroporosus]|uniref:GH16 domain-containing protein n=1 Tax=Boothiomyces macroporosus TaxID=261099 RepID=A0AAD5Y0M3_9FUNG|nr:hypothetical protein HK103_001884 [Boothiomyces macroporosus]
MYTAKQFALILLSLVSAQNSTSSGPSDDPRYTGSCLSTKYNLTDMSRIFGLENIPALANIPGLDVGRYDFTVDYNTHLVNVTSEGLQLTIQKNGDQNPSAPRVSTTRFIHYGKISVTLKAPAISGIVTTFIGMGPQLPDSRFDLSKANPDGGDEIDWEILGKDPMNIETNVFFRGFQELGPRGGYHPVKGGVAEFHKYTIDYQKDKITWLIDDVAVRTYTKTDPTALNSPNTHGIPFFPDRAMKVQFSLWSDKTNTWAGGAPAWPAGSDSAYAVYKDIEIQCYDDNMNPVPKWPLNSQNPDYTPTAPGQPTIAVNGTIPPQAAVGGQSIAPATTNAAANPSATGASGSSASSYPTAQASSSLALQISSGLFALLLVNIL